MTDKLYQATTCPSDKLTRQENVYRITMTRLAVGVAIPVLMDFWKKRGSNVDQSTNQKLRQC